MKPGVHHAEYMLLPRLAAMSEVAWATERRDYDDFVRRLGTLKISILKKEFAAAGTPEAALRLEQLETLLSGFATITPEAGWSDRLSRAKQELNELSR